MVVASELTPWPPPASELSIFSPNLQGQLTQRRGLSRAPAFPEPSCPWHGATERHPHFHSQHSACPRAQAGLRNGFREPRPPLRPSRPALPAPAPPTPQDTGPRSVLLPGSVLHEEVEASPVPPLDPGFEDALSASLCGPSAVLAWLLASFGVTGPAPLSYSTPGAPATPTCKSPEHLCLAAPGAWRV